VVVIGAALALVPSLAPAAAHKAHVCRGTLAKPGTLKGRNPFGVVVKGVCFVDAGPARVSGTIKLEPRSALAAAFGSHGSKLTVAGDVVVGRGATFVIGCGPPEFACFDDPAFTNPAVKPTLKSSGSVSGNVIASGALATLIHFSKIGGDVRQSGGGGGKSCAVPKTGPFAAAHSPIYSDYEDARIGGSVIVSKLTSCYLGIARLHVSGAMSLTQNHLGDPDAIEVLSNHIRGDLACRGNSAVWDSNELKMMALFPRKLDRNSVRGKRSGQCKKAGPLAKGGKPAGGPF
jgi:hypothetical protein